MSIFDESIIKYVQNVSSELRNRFVEIFRSCWALPYTKWMLTKWTKCECALCMQRVFSIWIIAAWKRCANSQSFKKQHFSGGNTIKPTWTHVKCVILWINYRFHRNVYSLLTQRKQIVRFLAESDTKLRLTIFAVILVIIHVKITVFPCQSNVV